MDPEPELRRTTRFRRLVHVVSCDSTQRLSQEDPGGDCAVFWADHQTAGRGRQGRSWHDSPADDLTATLRLCGLALPNPARLAAAVPVAVREAIAATCGEPLAARVRIKWPNDLLLDGRKVCGVLIDSRGRPAEVHHVGVGINVNRTTFPDELAAQSASLGPAIGAVVDRVALLCALAAAVDRAATELVQGATDRLALAFRRGLGLLGQQVRVTTGQRAVTGTLTGLDLDELVVDGREHLTLAHVHHVTPVS